jgi:hypothetical protein
VSLSQPVSPGEVKTQTADTVVTSCTSQGEVSSLCRGSACEVPPGVFKRDTELLAHGNCSQFSSSYLLCLGCDSSVGTANLYRLHGPGIEFRRPRDFPHPS